MDQFVKFCQLIRWIPHTTINYTVSILRCETCFDKYYTMRAFCTNQTGFIHFCWYKQRVRMESVQNRIPISIIIKEVGKDETSNTIFIDWLVNEIKIHIASLQERISKI